MSGKKQSPATPAPAEAPAPAPAAPPAGRAPNVAILRIPTLGTITLERREREVKLPKADAKRLGQEVGYVKSWQTVRTVEQTVNLSPDADDDDDDDVVQITRSRSRMVFPAPTDADGKPLPLPQSVTLSTFGQEVIVALESIRRMPRRERRDGKETGRLIPRPPFRAGTVAIARKHTPWGFNVAIAASPDGKAWYVTALLAQ